MLTSVAKSVIICEYAILRSVSVYIILKKGVMYKCLPLTS